MQNDCVLLANRRMRQALTVVLLRAGTPVGASDRVQDFLKSPFDLATFGPRLAVGALLSAQETVGNL